jgi:hypothetical protein
MSQLKPVLDGDYEARLDHLKQVFVSKIKDVPGVEEVYLTLHQHNTRPSPNFNVLFKNQQSSQLAVFTIMQVYAESRGLMFHVSNHFSKIGFSAPIGAEKLL